MTKKLLTEAEILKMSDKDYMNEDQLAFFKNRLEQLQADILKNAGQTTENLRETVIVPDPADRATIEEEHALELRTRDRERKLLKKVQQSLARIDSGDYGWCEKPASRSAFRACSRVRPPRCRSKRKSAASCARSCSATDRAAFRSDTLPKARGLPRAFPAPVPRRPPAADLPTPPLDIPAPALK